MARNSCAARCLLLAGIFALCFVSVPSRFANGFAHFWQIKEVYSNADGSVQFVEMFTTAPSEVFTTGTTLTVNDGSDNSFTLNHDLSQSTSNRHLLFATPGFLADAGISPDFTFLSAPFFNPNAATITVSYSASGDQISFFGDDLPKDGVNSLTNTSMLFFPPNLVSGPNSPTNLNNQSGMVVPPPSNTGDYNGNGFVDAADYVFWRKTLNQAAVPAGSGADGDGDGTVNGGDYAFWRERFGDDVTGAGAQAGSAIPEPANGALVLAACAAMRFVGRTRRPEWSKNQRRRRGEPFISATAT